MGNFFGKEKKMVILRGLPGCGKTTTAKQITVQNGVVFSTNDYFYENGIYKFDAKKLKDAHLWNQQRTKDAMEKDEGLIVIDNNNVRKWEAKPYVELATKFGYTVEFQTVETLWKFTLDELVSRNTHNIPNNIIQRMIDQWENDFTIETVLESRAPWE